MNILAARVYGSNFATTKLTGSIYVNGSPRDDELFRKISAYVLQVSRDYCFYYQQEYLD